MQIWCSTLLTVTIFYLIFFVRCNEKKEKYYSTSVADMESLLYIEENLIDSVEKFTEELEAKVNALKNLLRELKAENQKALVNTKAYLHNPLNCFSLIRRLNHDWLNIELFMQKPIGQSHVKVLQSYRPKMPTTRDLYDASQGIVRLQETYGLKASDMANGILDGKQYSAKLNPIDSFFIGSHLFAEKAYDYAAFWIYNLLGYHVDSDYTRILEFTEESGWALYAEILLKQNRPEDALTSITIASDLKPEDAALLKRKNEIEYFAKIKSEPPVKNEAEPPNLYEIGCRGGFSQKPSRFHCLYNSTTSAFLRLAPLKMEIIQLDPYLVLFHDVISDKEIKELQELATPTLERATVYNDERNQSVAVDERTSKFSWFQDDISTTTFRLNRRIKDMTGFSLKGSEMLQVMNYGIGGHYDTHYDFFNLSDTAEVVREDGDRISTVLFYLSDVEQGGATVFPHIETAVFPRKGSAVVWYNLNNRLEGDWRTLHAACPVIVGSKWVCNKWLRAKAQMFRKPCYK